jgi:hypothetical protein
MLSSSPQVPDAIKSASHSATGCPPLTEIFCSFPAAEKRSVTSQVPFDENRPLFGDKPARDNNVTGRRGSHLGILAGVRDEDYLIH